MLVTMITYVGPYPLAKLVVTYMMYTCKVRPDILNIIFCHDNRQTSEKYTVSGFTELLIAGLSYMQDGYCLFAAHQLLPATVE